LILLFACLLLAIAAWIVFDRRRHTRLKAACGAAFEQAYSSTLRKPALEMGYSYGEPVFQVMFAARDDMLAAAGANAAFLQAIDELCKNRGRKRRFKAQRAVFFQHPSEDEPVVQHCCATMRAQVDRTVAYSPDARAYGLKTSKVGTPPLAIAHCPWCGSGLPPEARPGA
jgi:hypothetical protein